MNCEQVNPYRHDSRQKNEQIEEMFNNIAPAYDFMNRAMTLGIDRTWRRKAVRTLPKGNDIAILDIATGTGDLALLIQKITGSEHITGIDLAENMLEIARQKAAAAPKPSAFRFLKADSLAMPFPDNSFHCITAAYGVRNFTNLLEGYREMFRVLKPGGMLAVLELSTPANPLVKPLYNIYTRRLIPAVGRLVAGDSQAYTYLPQSIAAVPQGSAMLALMQQAGFTHTLYKTFTFGTCSFYTAFKP